MKKILLAVATLVCLTSAMGQPALKKGLEGKRLSPDDLHTGIYVGTLSNMDAWIFEGKKKVKQMVLTDVNLELVSAITLPKSGSMEVLAAGVKGDRAGVLLADGSDNKRTVVYGCEIETDDEGMAGGRYDTLLTLDYTKKDRCMVWGAASPSGAYMALAAVVEMVEKKQYRTYVAVFDGAAQMLWEREYPLESMQDMKVTDEGRLVTLGMEANGDETRYVYNVFDVGRANTYGVTVKCDPVEDLRLVNVVGSTAVAVGVFHPVDVKKADRFVNGVVGIAFDVDNAELKGFTMRPFQNEDMNIFLNKKTKKIQKEQFVDHCKVLGTTATPWGAAVLLGRVLTTEKTSSSGAVSREGYGVGLHVAAVDTAGKVRWTRNVRRNDKDEEDGNMEQVALTTADGKVCLVRSEPVKSPLIYDIANEAKEYETGDKCHVMLYTMADDGSTEKIVLEPKVKQHVVRALTRADGTLMYFTKRGDKTRMAELRFNY